MSLILMPTAISQPGTQVSASTSTSTAASASTTDQKTNDASSFGNIFKHSLTSASSNPAVDKVTASTLEKTSARLPIRSQADSHDASKDANPQNPAAALLFAMMPATAATANPTTGASLPTAAETQLNQAIAAASGQNGALYTSQGNAGKALAGNPGAGTADSTAAKIAVTPTAAQPTPTTTAAQPAVTIMASSQQQRQQVLPAASGTDAGDATALAPITGNAIPPATASDTGSSQQHAQHGHDKDDTQVSQSEATTTPAAAPLSGAAQTIAIAANAATTQPAATLADQISPGALLALNPTPAAPIAAVTQPVAAAAPLSLPLAPPVGSNEWAGALSQQVIFMGNANHQVAELHLNPPDLGPLKVTLTMSDNQAQAIFVSGQESVRAAVEAALPLLRTNLADNGINLGHTSVSADTPQQQSAFAQKQDGQSAQRNNPGASTSTNVAANSTPLASTPSVSSSSGAIDIFA